MLVTYVLSPLFDTQRGQRRMDEDEDEDEDEDD